jgi:hypothetical protein
VASAWVDSLSGTLTIMGVTLGFYALVFGAMWWRLGGYQGGHRGVYKFWPWQTANPIALGELYLTVIPWMRGFEQQQLDNMVNIHVSDPDKYFDQADLLRLRTQRSMPWVVPRD